MRSKPMTFGGMLVLLVVVIAFVPMLLKLLRGSVSGFDDMQVAPVAGATAMSAGRYVQDPNTDYLCRSPNDSGVPCPEGQFCDGTRQACERKSIPAQGEVVGYFA
jgi:hypothetical protein